MCERLKRKPSKVKHYYFIFLIFNAIFTFLLSLRAVHYTAKVIGEPYISFFFLITPRIHHGSTSTSQQNRWSVTVGKYNMWKWEKEKVTVDNTGTVLRFRSNMQKNGTVFHADTWNGDHVAETGTCVCRLCFVMKVTGKTFHNSPFRHS